MLKGINNTSFLKSPLKTIFLQKINEHSFSTCLKLNKVKYEKQENNLSNSKDYVCVYSFPFIRHVSMVNRLKLYQTVLVSLSVPTMGILTQQNILSVDTLIAGSIVGSALCGGLFSAGYFINNLIGFIYYNQRTETTKISYVDFWGNRQNIEVPVEDIVPLCDIKPTVLDKLYVKFQRYSKKDTLKLNLEFGVINDNDKFQKIL